jgi:hypothetical protein
VGLSAQLFSKSAKTTHPEKPYSRRRKNLVSYMRLLMIITVALASSAGELIDVFPQRLQVKPYDARAQPRAARGMPRTDGRHDQRWTVPTSRRGASQYGRGGDCTYSKWKSPKLS